MVQVHYGPPFNMYKAIVGSREFKNLQLVKDYVNSLPKDTTVVSGGARGVDTCAVFEAKRIGLKTIVIKANWMREGHLAGFIRNSRVVKLIKEEQGEIHAFWDELSKGTLDTIHKAEDDLIPIFVHKLDGSVEERTVPF